MWLKDRRIEQSLFLLFDSFIKISTASPLIKTTSAEETTLCVEVGGAGGAGATATG